LKAIAAMIGEVGLHEAIVRVHGRAGAAPS
jgi:hypothetical protein